ncbi:MAG: TonB-dependent receptor [Caulobacteraceae bacterium]|nr:TonB-dependent receptor [Caulobacteraceae bacterium]
MRRRQTALGLLTGVGLLGLGPAAGAAVTAADGAASVSEVIVTAPRQEDKAREVQFAAPNLISVQPADTILKYPDYNAAEALGRIPGISLSSDTGEGRFVQIRGIDANLDGATYGGVPLLNTNPGGTAAGGGGRAVEFDTIPTGAIDGVIVTYTLLPDHEAEGLGGSIELTPRTATRITKPFFDATLGWGYEPLHDHTGPFEADIAFGARFGFGDRGLAIQNGAGSLGEPRAGWISNPAPFSFVITASRQDDRRAVDDLEAGYIDGDAPSNAISEYNLRRYDYHRRRFSYGGEFDFQPNDDHTYYIRGGVAGYTESVHKNFLLFNDLDADPLQIDPNNSNGYLVTTDPAIRLTDEEEVHRNQIYAIGGADRFGDILLDYHAAYSRATFHVRRNIGATFTGPTVPFTYDNVTTPNFPIFGFPAGTNVDDPSIYSLDSLSNEQDFDVDEEYSYAANLTFPLRLINDSDRIKIGGQARLRDKVATEFDEDFEVPGLSLSGLSGPAIRFYDGHYTDGPQIDRYAIGDLIATGAAVSGGPQFNPESFIAATENIYAGYVQYTTTIGKWGLLAGVRVEATDARYGGFVPDIADEDTLVLQTRPVSYVDAFPTVQLRYAFTPRLIARATWSTGIGRPGFTQNTTAASIDRTADPFAITRGNPDLKPIAGDNFDLSLEYYLPNGGIVSLAAFDKEFQNYIVPRIQRGVTTDPLAPGQRADVTTFLNISTAYARGVQAAYHQKFTWLPRPLDGFGIEANLTLVDSEILEYTADQSLTGLAQHGLLPGTSQVTWNLAGFYEAHGIQTRLSAEYVSHSLFGLGGDKSLDTFQDSRLTVDLTSSYRLTSHWAVFFSAKNLTDEPLRYYEGAANRPIQREFYDITVEGGVRASF